MSLFSPSNADNSYIIRAGLQCFIEESWKIEGYYQVPNREKVLKVHKDLFLLEKLEVKDIEKFVKEIVSDKTRNMLRDKVGLDVRVGSHFPPKGGPEIKLKLQQLLDQINVKSINPWQAHVDYETLHGFCDGNGRSGRAIWAWHMYHIGEDPLTFNGSFLHYYYYQTLENSRKGQTFKNVYRRSRLKMNRDTKERSIRIVTFLITGLLVLGIGYLFAFLIEHFMLIPEKDAEQDFDILSNTASPEAIWQLESNEGTLPLEKVWERKSVDRISDFIVLEDVDPNSLTYGERFAIDKNTKSVVEDWEHMKDYYLKKETPIGYSIKFGFFDGKKYMYFVRF